MVFGCCFYVTSVFLGMWTEAGNRFRKAFATAQSSLFCCCVVLINPWACFLTLLGSVLSTLDWTFSSILFLLSMSWLIDLRSHKFPLTVWLCPRRELWIRFESSKGYRIQPLRSFSTRAAFIDNIGKVHTLPVSATISSWPSVLSSVCLLAIYYWVYQTLTAASFFFLLSDPTSRPTLWLLVICLHLLDFEVGGDT